MKKLFLALLVLVPFALVSCGSGIDSFTAEPSSLQRSIDYTCWPTSCPGPYDESVTAECYAEYMMCLPDDTEFEVIVTKTTLPDIFETSEEEATVMFAPGPPGQGGTQSASTSASKSNDGGCSSSTVPTTPISVTKSFNLGGGCSLTVGATAHVTSYGHIDNYTYGARASLNFNSGGIGFSFSVGYCDPFYEHCP